MGLFHVFFFLNIRVGLLNAPVSKSDCIFILAEAESKGPLKIEHVEAMQLC